MSITKHPGGRPRKNLSGKITQAPANGIYFTVEEAAELLDVNRRTVQARLRDGTLNGKKISGVWKIYPDSLLSEDLEGKKSPSMQK